VKWNKEAFDRLVLPNKTKDMVKSLVMVRAAQRGLKERRVLDSMRDDLIAGKGNGLIMLLHGGPGTGKTLTAGMSTIQRSPSLNSGQPTALGMNVIANGWPTER
jgi:hypothetical protein